MENELYYIEDFTVVRNQNIFHRSNEDEWKYVGTWGDLLESKSKQLIQANLASKDISSLFIAFGHYTSTLEIIKQNLINRNKYILHENLKKNKS